MTKQKVLPPEVQAAKLRGDTEALRAFGRAGGRKSAFVRRQRKLDMTTRSPSQFDFEITKEMREEAAAQERQDGIPEHDR